VSDTTVYLAPETFGFGPAALATAVARQIRLRHPDVQVAGVADGIAADFLNASQVFDGAVTESPPKTLPESLGTEVCGVVVVFGDFDRLKVARARDLRTVVVDALYWMWDSDPVEPDTVDLYFALAFPGVAERVSRRGPHARSIRIVPQIVDLALPAPETERSGVVLNLGGAVAPMGSNHTYLHALVELVAGAVGDEELLVTCSSAAAAALRRLGPVRGATIAELPFDQMMTTLGRCSWLLTLPGQSIMWEALRMQAPTVVLPGANYSHHRQLGAYRRFLADIRFIAWDDLDGYRTLPAGLPEKDGVARAVEQGDRLVTDQKARGRLAELIASALSADRAKPPTLRDGHPWSAFDGAVQVADEIAALARKAG
jgi:hypothetical protein